MQKSCSSFSSCVCLGYWQLQRPKPIGRRRKTNCGHRKATILVVENRVDTNRIYLTGLSRGGSAAWDMAVQYPETFAALAVVCGIAPTPYAHWLNKSMPIWVFHGSDDAVIPVSESDQMVKKLKKLGYDVRYDRYDGVNHNSWEKAYANDFLYEWMNQQKQN